MDEGMSAEDAYRRAYAEHADQKLADSANLSARERYELEQRQNRLNNQPQSPTASVPTPTEPYNRKKHYGNTPTAADRKAVGGSPDHDPPLVVRYYEGDSKTGEKPGYLQTPVERKASAKDRSRMTPSTKEEQNKQGGQMSQYSKEQKLKYGFTK